MFNLISEVNNSRLTQLAYFTSLNLEFLNAKLPSDDEILQLIQGCDSTVEVAHRINEYYVSLLKEALLNISHGHREALKDLLSVNYYKVNGYPADDYCSVRFMGFTFNQLTKSNMESLRDCIDDYILNIYLGNFRGNVTFSLSLPQSAIDKLVSENLSQYLSPLVFSTEKKNSVTTTVNEYLLAVGRMRQDDIETRNHFAHFERTTSIIREYNRFINHVEDFLPDFLLIQLAKV